MFSDRTIQAGEKTYPVRFGHNALYLLEEYLMKLHREGVLQRRKFITKDEATGKSVETEWPISAFDLGQLPRHMNVQVGLWVALEGGRRKQKTRLEPFTLEEAADILDNGNFDDIERIIGEMYRSAFPEIFKTKDSSKDSAETTEKNAPVGDSTGTLDSSTPPLSESASTTSGN